MVHNKNWIILTDLTDTHFLSGWQGLEYVDYTFCTRVRHPPPRKRRFRYDTK